MSEHTPGPWRTEFGCSSICAGEDYTLARVYWSEGRGEVENVANANLLAAGPDLLAACETVLAKLDYLTELWGQEGVTRGVQDTLRAAIAKAKGAAS